MLIKTTKSDIIWSYIAQFFNIGAGIITLPLVLNKLNTDEIALNYIMLTISSMVALIDFGFAPQFGRNVTYVFSGAQTLEKQGLSDIVSDVINFRLLKNLIGVAKRVYVIMSFLVLLIMTSFGTWYIYEVTNGFTSVDNSLLIWLVFSISVFFNVYFYYYSSLLTGRGQIKEERKARMASKIAYIFLSYLFILLGMGLLGLCLANIISPFIARFIEYHYFYDKELRDKLKHERTSWREMKGLFSVIWFNAKKLGLNFVGGYTILKFSMFIVGFFLTSTEISSYGLMMQLVAVMTTISTTFFNSMVPQMTSLRVLNDRSKLLSLLSGGMSIYYLSFGGMGCILLIFGPIILQLIGSNAVLPSAYILMVYLLVSLLEGNHGLYSTFITTNNDIPFVKSALISGISICVLDFLVLKYTNSGLFGIVLIQGLVQLAYNNWKWPMMARKELNVTAIQVYRMGAIEILKMGRNLVNQVSQKYKIG